MDEEVRLTDAIPRRLTTYLLLLLGGIAVIAGIEILHAWLPTLKAYTSDHRVTAFDLSADASLAVYFSSAALQLAGLIAILVYRIRRHRVDDYHGQYRIWLWAALCWFLLSADEVAQLHHGFKGLMVAVTGVRFFGDGSLWWVVPYFFLLGGVGLRLLVEMRECILSTVVGSVAAVLCAAALVMHCHWVVVDLGERHVMIELGLKLGAELLLLLAMLLHGRHVILDVEGKLRRPERKIVVRKPKKSAAIDFQEVSADESDEEQAATSESKPATEAEQQTSPTVKKPATRAADPAHPTPPSPASRAGAVPSSLPALTLGHSATTSSSATPASNASAQSHKKMTKAEKKALRKRLENMRRDREGKDED